MKTKSFFLLSLVQLFFLFGLALPELVYAGLSDRSWIIEVYNGYEGAYKAWQKIGLVLGSNSYKMLFFGIIVLGAFVAFVAVYVKLAMGSNVPPFRSWVAPVLAGVLVYLSLVYPPGGIFHQIVIYDKFLNKYSPPVTNIPPLIAAIAGVTNRIERGLIEIFDTGMDVLDKYEYNPGGIAFMISANFFNDLRSFVDPRFSENINYYIHDCLFPAFQAGYVSIDDIVRKSLSEIFTLASSGSNYVKYRNASGNLVVMTCLDVSPYLLADMNAGRAALNLNNPQFRAFCSANGFDVTNYVALTKCGDLVRIVLNDFYPRFGLSSFSNLMDIAYHYEYANLILSSSGTGSGSITGLGVTATSSTISSFLGAMIHANSWVPVLKEGLRAFGVILIPVILLFIATPIFGRALSVILGMQIWIVTWSVVDVLITGLSLSLAKQLGNTAGILCPSCSGPNVLELMAFPSGAAKLYATIGMMRWAGIGLATFITTMLIRFGGTVLAMVAGQIASAPMGAGASAGQSVLRDPHNFVTSDLVPRISFANVAFQSGGVGSFGKSLASYSTFGLASQTSAGEVLLKASGGKIGEVAEAGRLAGRLEGMNKLVASYTGVGIEGKEKEFASGLAEIKLRDITYSAKVGESFKNYGGGTRVGEIQAEVGIFEEFKKIGTGETLSKKDPKRLGTVAGRGQAALTIAQAQAFDEIEKRYENLDSIINNLTRYEITKQASPIATGGNYQKAFSNLGEQFKVVEGITKMNVAQEAAKGKVGSEFSLEELFKTFYHKEGTGIAPYYVQGNFGALSLLSTLYKNEVISTQGIKGLVELYLAGVQPIGFRMIDGQPFTLFSTPIQGIHLLASPQGAVVVPAEGSYLTSITGTYGRDTATGKEYTVTTTGAKKEESSRGGSETTKTDKEDVNVKVNITGIIRENMIETSGESDSSFSRKQEYGVKRDLIMGAGVSAGITSTRESTKPGSSIAPQSMGFARTEDAKNIGSTSIQGNLNLRSEIFTNVQEGVSARMGTREKVSIRDQIHENQFVNFQNSVKEGTEVKTFRTYQDTKTFEVKGTRAETYKDSANVKTQFELDLFAKLVQDLADSKYKGDPFAALKFFLQEGYGVLLNLEELKNKLNTLAQNVQINQQDLVNALLPESDKIKDVANRLINESRRPFLTSSELEKVKKELQDYEKKFIEPQKLDYENQFENMRRDLTKTFSELDKAINLKREDAPTNPFGLIFKDLSRGFPGLSPDFKIVRTSPQGKLEVNHDIVLHYSQPKVGNDPNVVQHLRP